MNARHVIPIFGALAALPAAYFLYPRANADESINPDRSWAPTAADIRAAIKPGLLSGPEDPRLDAFAQLFKKRYREHQRAIGIKFVADKELKAMFEPAISRWEMAELAGQLDLESSQIFGRHFDIGIYETYITAIRKIGELKYDPASKKHIVRFGPQYEQAYLYRAANERASVESVERMFGDLMPKWKTSPDQPTKNVPQRARPRVGFATSR